MLTIVVLLHKILIVIFTVLKWQGEIEVCLFFLKHHSA